MTIHQTLVYYTITDKQVRNTLSLTSLAELTLLLKWKLKLLSTIILNFHIFKANPKMPSVIDCLKLKCDETYGNYITIVIPESK